MKDKHFYTDYAADIMETYYEDEKIPFIAIRDHQLDIRNELIDIIKTFSKYQGFANSTVHLSVLFLDIYMNSYILSDIREHQKFVALVTVLLAAKSEDLDSNICSTKDLLKMVDLSEELGIDLRFANEYEEKEIAHAFKKYSRLYCTLEYLIFQSLDFKTIRSSSITFLNVFQKLVITEADMTDIEQNNTNEQIIESFGDLELYANDRLTNLSDILLYNMEFYEYLPSKVAAAMIATVRKLLGIRHFWNMQLQKLTRANIDEIIPIVDLFIDKRKQHSVELKVDDTDNEIYIDDSGYYDSSLTQESQLENDSKKRRISP